MKQKIIFGLFIFFLVGQVSLPVLTLAAEPVTGLKKVSEFRAEDLLDLLNSKIDLKSFLGKPVKIPLTFESGATDSIFLVPPQFFIDQKTQKITVTPTRTMYLADGKSVSEEKIRYVRDELEKELNKIMAEKKELIDQLRAALLNQNFSNEQLQSKFKTLKLNPNQGSWIDWLLPFVKAEDPSGVDMGALQQLLTQTQNSTGTATEGLAEDDALAEIISSENPKSRELLSLLLLLLIYKNAIAEADNTDKTNCTANGGEWVAEQCAYPEEEAVSADEKNVCTDSGGEWKTDFSQRKICMAFCGATDDGCTDKILEEKISRSGCICPTGQCVTAAGDCLVQDESKKDKDEDEIPDSIDKCPNTKDQGDGVNMEESSADYGCSCADLQAKGRIQQRQCPGGGCEGAYLVQYNQSSGTDSCQNGVISQFNCVANRYPSQQCQQSQNNNNNQNKNDNSNWQDMLKDLMGNKDNGNGGGQQGGGQQGGGDQGGGDQKSGCSSCGQQQTPEQQQATLDRINKLTNLAGQKAAENVQDVINENYKSGEGSIKDPTQAANFSEAIENYSRANPTATPEQVRKAANRWVSDNLAPGDKVSSAERAKIYEQIEKATTGGATAPATSTRTYPDGSTESTTHYPDGSTTKTTSSPDGSTTTTKYDPNGKQVETSTTAPSMWDYPQDPQNSSLNKTPPPEDLWRPVNDTGESPFEPMYPGVNKNPGGDNILKPGDEGYLTAKNDFWNNTDLSKSMSEAMFNNNIALDKDGFDFFESQVRPGFDNSGTPNTDIGEYVGTPSSSDLPWNNFNDLDPNTINAQALNGFGFTPEEIEKIIEGLVKRKPDNEEGDKKEDSPEEQEQINKDQKTLDGGGSIET